MLLSTRADAANSYRIRKRSETTGYGDFWNPVAGAFEATEPAATALAETEAGSRHYTAILPALEDYTGLVEVFYYQDVDQGDGSVVEKWINSEIVELADGVPIPTVPPVAVPVDADLSDIDVSRYRTWELKPISTGGLASKTLTMPVGSVEWLAFNFSGLLDDSDSINSVVSVTDLNSILSIAVDAQKVSSSRREVHIQPTGYNAGQESQVQAKVLTALGRTLVGLGFVRGE